LPWQNPNAIISLTFSLCSANKDKLLENARC